MNPTDLATIVSVTNKSQEIMFKKAKEKLKNKFEALKSNEERRAEPRYVKNPVLNLIGDDMPEHHQELLSLGPKFVPSAKYIPHMDIVATTESSSLKLEYSNKLCEAQTLRKDVLRILKMAKPIKDNLTENQRRAMSEIKKEDSISIYPYDKGSGLVRMHTDEAIRKIQEQIGNTRILDEDPTPTFTRNIQIALSKLKK